MLAEWHQTINEINNGLHQAQIAGMQQTIEQLQTENAMLHTALRQKRILIRILRDYGHISNPQHHHPDEQGNCTHWLCRMAR